MSRKLTYLAVCCFLVFSESAESATKIAHWRLDNDATDSAGVIDGTLMNGPEFTTDAIVGSHALVLDGSMSQYVDFGNPQELPAGRSARSMCGWAKTDTIAGGWRWIAAYGSGGTSLAMFIGMNGTSLYGGGYGDDIFVSGFWEIGVWRHICLTYDGSIARLYADGDEVISATKNWDLVLNRAHIGRQVNDVAEFWDGMIDDVRIYDYALSPAEVKKLAALPKATKPSPADGAIRTDTWASLSWSPGGYAASHDVYFGEGFDDVNDGAGGTFQGSQDADSLYFVVGFSGYPYPDGLVPGTTYYWRIDEVNDLDPNSPWKGDVWSFTVPSKTAYNPNPPDGAEFINPDTILSWTAGFEAKIHTVFFGDNFDDVSSATEGMSPGTFTYDPGTLEYDKSYYWRIDEFDGSTTYKGNIWSFKTLPDIPISDPNLVCWWKLDEGQGTTVIDWSGHKNDGTLINGPKWVAGYDEGALEFDGSDDYINFSNTSNLPAGNSARSMCAWAKTDTVAAGWRWIAAYGSPGTSQAMFIGMLGSDLVGGGYGSDDVFNNGFWEVDVWRHICLTYDGTTARLYADGIEVAAEAKSWDLVLSRAHIGRQVNDMAEFWDGLIDDVRIYNRVLTPEEIQQAMRGDTSLAWDSSPADGSIPDIHLATPLSWSPGDKATEHDVYFGTDINAVMDADTSTAVIYRGRQSATSYTPPEDIEWGGGPYYWRIDEYNTDGTVSTGRIWSFTVADYLIIDDFESYNTGDPIWEPWPDGLGFGAPGTPGYFAGNGTGAAVGDESTVSYTEETIVHGGSQSMPLAYDNNKQGYAYYSEVEHTLTGQRDWTEEAVTELSLWFRGYAASVGSFAEGPVGTYTMTASGTDIWNNGPGAGEYHDEFHFAYKMLTGAGLIIARVDSVENTNGWAKAGVMIRDTLDPDSKHAFACITPANGVASQGRPDTGAASFNTAQGGITAPYWVKLERSISGSFTVSHSANGSSWQPVTGDTSQIISMGTNVYVGLALTSHDATLTCGAVFSNVTISEAVGAQWTHQDIGIASNDAETLYVAVSNSAGIPAVVVHDDPDAATIDIWTEWIIPLQTFADQGINLTDVDRIAIGLGAKGNLTMPGGSGKMFFDDIRLYRSRNAAEE